MEETPETREELEATIKALRKVVAIEEGRATHYRAMWQEAQRRLDDLATPREDGFCPLCGEMR